MIAHPTTLVAEAAPTPEDVAKQAAALPLAQRVEAILVTAERALSTTRIAASLDEPGKAVEAAIESLNASWEQTQRVMRIMRSLTLTDVVQQLPGQRPAPWGGRATAVLR